MKTRVDFENLIVQSLVHFNPNRVRAGVRWKASGVHRPLRAIPARAGNFELRVSATVVKKAYFMEQVRKDTVLR